MGKKSSKPEVESNPGVILVWMRRTSAPMSRLSGNITREIYTYLQPLLCLPWVNSHQIRYYDFQRQTILEPVPLKSAIQASWNSRWAVIDIDRLVLCGGNEVLDRFSVRGRQRTSCTATAECILPDMLEGHSCCGLIVWKCTVQVFGSLIGKAVARCESLDLREPSQWEQLPDMHQARAKFTPTLWKEAIYLCGGHHNNTLEVFDGHRMQLLGLRLPESGKSLSCIGRNSLLVLTSNYLTILSSKASNIHTRIIKHSPTTVFAFTEPVCYREEMYCFYCGKVEKYEVPRLT